MKPSLAPFLDRQEPLETESVAWKSRTYECRHECSCSRKGLDLYTFTDACPYEEEPGIGNPRRAGITDESDICSGKNSFFDNAGCLVLVELVVRLLSWCLPRE